MLQELRKWPHIKKKKYYVFAADRITKEGLTSTWIAWLCKWGPISSPLLGEQCKHQPNPGVYKRHQTHREITWWLRDESRCVCVGWSLRSWQTQGAMLVLSEGSEGSRALPAFISIASTRARSQHLAISPPSHSCSPPAESNPTQSRFLSSSRLRLLCKKKKKKINEIFFPTKMKRNNGRWGLPN